MEKGKFKKPIIIAALVLAVIIISITYLFAINNYSLMGNIWNTIVDIFMPFIIGVVIVIAPYAISAWDTLQAVPRF